MNIKPPEYLSRKEKRIFKQIPCWFNIDLTMAAMLAVELNNVEYLIKEYHKSNFGGKLQLIETLNKSTSSTICILKEFMMIP